MKICKRQIFTISVSLLLAAPLTQVDYATASAYTIPATAIHFYNAGLASKSANPQQALNDFKKAAKLAPQWEAPVYQIGIVLARQSFNQALPWYLKALNLNPQDDSIWNMIGWGFYQDKTYPKAMSAFQNQLRLSPDNPYALWGLANCYGNSQVRAYAKARHYLQSLQGTSEQASAQKMLKTLPPNDVDATHQPTQPITYEDAIAMALSYRIEPNNDVATYIDYASTHGLLETLAIPSYQAPATRLFLALFLAKLYGINQFDYIRPFPLTDMTSVPIKPRSHGILPLPVPILPLRMHQVHRIQFTLKAGKAFLPLPNLFPPMVLTVMPYGTWEQKINISGTPFPPIYPR